MRRPASFPSPRPAPATAPFAVAAVAMLALLASACAPDATAVAPPPDASEAPTEAPTAAPIGMPAGTPSEAPTQGAGEAPVGQPAEQPSTQELPPVAIDWSARPGPTELGDGWVVMGCEGDAPMLCVERHGAFVGVVELVVYDAPPADPDRTTFEQLSDLVEDFLATFREDRGTTCPELQFVGQSAAPAPFGDHEGVTYGFLLRTPSGPVVERTAGHMVLADGRMAALAVNAATEDGCVVDEMIGFTPDQLASFQPHLARLAAGSTNWSGV